MVITGGEPTLHGENLVELISQIKKMGYLVKLDTNGTNPKLLKRLITNQMIDYVAIDLKTSLSEYNNLTNTTVDLNLIKESIDLLKDSGNQKMIEVEFRTTLHPKLHTKEIFQEMIELIANAPLYALQTFRPNITLDSTYQSTQPFTEKKMEEYQRIAETYVKVCLLR